MNDFTRTSQWIGMAGSILLFASGCSIIPNFTTWNRAVEVKLEENFAKEKPTVQVDLIGIRDDAISNWKKVTVTDYWDEKSNPTNFGKARLEFLGGTNSSQTITNLVLKGWRKGKVTSLVVIKDFPSTLRPGADENRREVFSFRRKSYQPLDGKLVVEIGGTNGISVVNPPPPPR